MKASIYHWQLSLTEALFHTMRSLLYRRTSPRLRICFSTMHFVAEAEASVFFVALGAAVD